MKNTAVQHGLRRANTGRLQSLWVELPGFCNLACTYCYARGGKPNRPDDLLSKDDYNRLLAEAESIGVDSLGIPGAGEPFIERNLELTMWFLTRATELGMFVTVFTTGEFLTEELIAKLKKLPVELMLKGNTLDPEEQDKFVSDPAHGRNIEGYGAKRNATLQALINAGFNSPEDEIARKFGRESRLALVTSIMASDEPDGPSNVNDVAEVLRFCRKNNIIFDCDSVLDVGRAQSCHLKIPGEGIKVALLELQQIDKDEFGQSWELSQSYVGTVCDRYMHHMYISQYGDVRPCIGAEEVKLGSVKTKTLDQAWESTEMRIVRSRCYGGKCGTKCANFAEGKCNSCLGRRAKELSNEQLCRDGFVDTEGCWNFRQKGE